jgi:hypothetical protein
VAAGGEDGYERRATPSQCLALVREQVGCVTANRSVLSESPSGRVPATRQQVGRGEEKTGAIVRLRVEEVL